MAYDLPQSPYGRLRPSYGVTDTRRTRRWRKVRAGILAAAGGACSYCGGMATEVHHLVPVRRGGTDDPTNLVAVCHDCHKQLL